MNKTELIAALAAETGLPKKSCEAAVTGICEITARQLSAGGKVSIRGYGTITLRKRGDRRAVRLVPGLLLRQAADKAT